MNYPKYFLKSDRSIENEEILHAKVEAIIRIMTEEEKLNFCHGGENPADCGQVGNGGYMPGLPRAGVPEIRMYDGPAGVTSVYDTTGLPVQQLLASTWSPELAYQFGEVMGSENASISGNCQLGAQYDITRIPHFGRSRDMLGEDPMLASAMAAEETKGIQKHGTIATLKHFAGYTQSGSPLVSADMRIDEQTLHEMYLRPFEAAVAKGGAASIMCTYNKINGRWAASSPYLHQYVIRELWKFKGSVMSDWGATHRLCTHLGMDIEMPNGMYNSNERIRKGILKGKLTWGDIDNVCRHVLWTYALLGYLALVKLDIDGNVLLEENRTTPIHLTDTYHEDVEKGLFAKNAEIAYEIDTKGMTLLKNENNMLPLQKTDDVAVIGLGAMNLISGYDQERSFGCMARMISPYEALSAQLNHVEGAVAIDMVGTAIPSEYFWQDSGCTKHGLIRTYGITEENGACPSNFGPGGAGVEFTGIPVFADDEDSDNDNEDADEGMMLSMDKNAKTDMDGHETGSFAAIDDQISFVCGTIDGKVNQTYFNSEDGNAFRQGEAYSWNGYLTVPETGDYTLALQAIGGLTAFRIALDGEHYEFVGNSNTREGSHWAWGGRIPTPEGMDIQSKIMHLEAGRVYPIKLYASATLKYKDLQFRLSWITPSQKLENYEKALKLAASHKKVLLFVYSNKEAESNMMQFPVTTTSLKLPEDQEKLLEDVLAAAENAGNQVAVCINNTIPVVMSHWIDRVDAVVDMWLGGQEGGRAIADLLIGRKNFSGKLAQSLPMCDEDTPVTDTPEHRIHRHDGYGDDQNRLTVDFSEGVFFGYRWYDRENRKPQFPFGYGLSYTQFTVTDPAITESDDGLTVSVCVTNTGAVTGDEIVQCYLTAGRVPEYTQMPDKQLAAFARAENLQPGESRRVEMKIDPRTLCYWDIHADLTESSWGTAGKWRTAKGRRGILVGDSSEKLIQAGWIER